MFKERYEKKLLFQEKAGLLRRPESIAGREGRYIFIGSRRVLNFASNDYLGLGVSGELGRRVARNFRRYGASSSSSRLVSGNYAVIARAEGAYARYFGYEAALFFPSGYQANIGILSALFEKGDTLFFDKHIHSSSVKGMTLSGASFHGYNHNDLSHLRKRLQAAGGGDAAVVTESLFSMDGDVLDAPGFGLLRKEFGFFSIVDEAHAFGALGEGGRGLARDAADVAVGTFGKALGLFGAFVLLTERVKEYLFNFSSPLIYSTTLPEAHAASALDVLEILEGSDKARSRLASVSSLMKQGLTDLGFTVRGDAHIISWEMGDEKRVLEWSRELLARDIFIFPVRPPTVPPGKAMIRISMTALHREEDVERLLHSVRDMAEKERRKNE